MVLEKGTYLPDPAVYLTPCSFIFQPSRVLDDEKSRGVGVQD
jgi:hypothetical protein